LADGEKRIRRDCPDWLSSRWWGDDFDLSQAAPIFRFRLITNPPLWAILGLLVNECCGIACVEIIDEKEKRMDKDRIKGAAKQAKGAVKEAAGKVTGDTKLEAEGNADKAAGKVQNAIRGLKDTLRGK
jgi:uncharacterized protein YjbJ (UPF0337 family)